MKAILLASALVWTSPSSYAVDVAPVGSTSVTRSVASAGESQSLDFSNCKLEDQPCAVLVKNRDALQIQAQLEHLHLESEQAVLAHYKALAQHDVDVLSAQKVWSYIVLFMLIGIVSVGLAMSWLQMRNWFNRGVDGDNSFEFGKDGLKMKSPVIGLIIFLISTYYFSVFVDKVYAVTKLQSEATEAKMARSSAGPASAPEQASSK